MNTNFSAFAWFLRTNIEDIYDAMADSEGNLNPDFRMAMESLLALSED